MRGGAIPLLAWGAVLAVLGAINWIWTDDAVQVATFGFAVLVVVGGGVAAAVAHRSALRPGPPTADRDPEALPEVSVGAVLAALGVGSIAFGLVFGNFFVYCGAAVVLGAAGRLSVEISAQRRSRREARERRP